jgi:hypothetical protein
MRFTILLSLVALIIGVSIFLIIFSGKDIQAGFPLDDSWIHLRFAGNLADGYGFGLNPSQPTAGSTSPLWTLLLSGVIKAGIPPFYGAIGLSFLLLLLSCVFVSKLAGMIMEKRALVIAASIFVVFSPSLIWSSLAGLEVSLFVFLSTLGLWLSFGGDRRSYRIVGYVVLALSTQARPEGYLLFFIAALADTAGQYMKAKSGRAAFNPAAGILILVAVSAPYAIFSKLTSGHLFPNSFYAKTTGQYSLMPSPSYFLDVYRIFLTDNPSVAILLPLGLVSLAVREFRCGRVSVGTVLILWTVALPVAFSTMGRTALFAGAGGNFGRYYYILIPAAGILAVEGIRAVSSWLGAISENAARAGRIVLVAGVLIAGLIANISRGQNYALNVKNINEIDVAVAEWVAANTPEEAVIAANDVGAISYIGERSVIDLIGITNPEIIPRLTTRADLVEYLGEVKPDYMCVFDAWYPAIIQLLTQTGVMTRLHSVQIDDNITTGANVISIFRLDWNRRR